MSDPRELILARLKDVLASVPGVVTVTRNEVVAAESKLPAIMLLDGDENADPSAQGRGRPPSALNKMTLLPEVYFIIDEPPETVGTSQNAMRFAIIRAVLNDAQLLTLSQDQGIRYEGMQTALTLGRALIGEAAMMFAIDYTLRAPAPEPTTEPPSEP